MKFSIFLSVMLVAGVSLAGAVESAATFGVLKVASTNVETVVSVPWVAAGTGESVKVKDFVKTANMTAGDALYLYDASEQSYKEWVLVDGAWAGATTVKVTGIAAEAGENDTLDRGDALIIWRQNYNSGDTPADSIYLYGQYNSTGVTEYEMAYHTTAVKNTLFAPINTSGEVVYLNPKTAAEIDSGKTVVAAESWANVNKKDTIKVQDATGYAVFLSWNNSESKWGVYNAFANEGAGGWTYDAAVIQPGMGAWYQAAKGTRNGAPKLTTTSVTGTK